MRVTNPGDAVWLPAIESHVDHRETVDVEHDVGVQLIAQGWISARSTAAKKVARARKKEADQTSDAPELEPEPEDNPVPDPAGKD